jgi:hypothetical protein
LRPFCAHLPPVVDEHDAEVARNVGQQARSESLDVLIEDVLAADERLADGGARKLVDAAVSANLVTVGLEWDGEWLLVVSLCSARTPEVVAPR